MLTGCGRPMPVCHRGKVASGPQAQRRVRYAFNTVQGASGICDAAAFWPVPNTFGLQAVRAQASANDAKPSRFRGLPPDALQQFYDAQSNILELNRSRLQALEELKLARDKIAELGVDSALLCSALTAEI